MATTYLTGQAKLDFLRGLALGLRGVVIPVYREPVADITDASVTDGVLYIKNANAVLKDGVLEVK